MRARRRSHIERPVAKLRIRLLVRFDGHDLGRQVVVAHAPQALSVAQPDSGWVARRRSPDVGEHNVEVIVVAEDMVAEDYDNSASAASGDRAGEHCAGRRNPQDELRGQRREWQGRALDPRRAHARFDRRGIGGRAAEDHRGPSILVDSRRWETRSNSKKTSWADRDLSGEAVQDYVGPAPRSQIAALDASGSGNRRSTHVEPEPEHRRVQRDQSPPARRKQITAVPACPILEDRRVGGIKLVRDNPRTAASPSTGHPALSSGVPNGLGPSD